MSAREFVDAAKAACGSELSGGALKQFTGLQSLKPTFCISNFIVTAILLAHVSGN